MYVNAKNNKEEGRQWPTNNSMRIDDPNALLELGASIKNISAESGKILIETKNGATLTIVPTVSEDGTISGFDMNLLSSKENKAITKNLEKIEKLRKEIEETMSGCLTLGDDDENEDSEEGSISESVIQGLEEAVEISVNIDE